MHIRRTLPPAAAPLYLRDILSGLSGLHHGQGELVRFKSELEDYFGVKHCFLISSGRAALALILKALKLLYPDRNQVLIPAYTCYSVPSAVVRAGLNIRLCDMDPNNLDFDYTQLSGLLDSPDRLDKHNKFKEPAEPDKPNRPKELKQPGSPFLAIVPAHLFGIPSDIDCLRPLLGNTDIAIVEDAAQAMGGKWKGRKLGTLGDVGFFSLGRGKALSTAEGGIILTNREDIARQISGLLTEVRGYTTFELLRLVIEAITMHLFMRPCLFWLPKSLPFLRLGETIYDPGFKIRKMTSFQAGLARDWRPKIKTFRTIRKIHSTTWLKLMNDLEGHEMSATPPRPLDADLIRFPVRVRNPALRKTILTKSEQEGLGIMPGYPDSIDGISHIKGVFSNQKYPIAKQYSQQLITLPVHPFVSKSDTKSIAKLLSTSTTLRNA